LLFASLPFVASQRAYACPWVPTEQLVEGSALVFVGTIDEVDGEFVRFGVNRYLKGGGSSDVTIQWFAVDGRPSELPHLWLGANRVIFAYLGPDGAYATTDCWGDMAAASITNVEAITGPGVPPDGAPPQEEPAEPDGASTPWAIILPIAFAIPLAVLIVPALLRRRGGH